MSKFEYGAFYGGYDIFAVSKEKYTKEQAIDLAKEEYTYVTKPFFLAIGDGYVRHRAGRNEDGEPCVGWWLEYKEHKRSCPCWVFHKAYSTDERFSRDYEFILIDCEKRMDDDGKADLCG